MVGRAPCGAWPFYAYMDVGKGREQEWKLCPWMDGMPQGARDGGVAFGGCIAIVIAMPAADYLVCLKLHCKLN